MVLASYGRGVLVEIEPDGVRPAVFAETLRCSLRGRKQRLVCGDRIVFTYEPADDGASVQSVAPRRNLVERIDSRGRAEPVAANIDQLAIIVAPEPKPDWFLVDRYWAGARLKDIASLIVVNKADLGLDTVTAEIANYGALGMPCLAVSTRIPCGLAEFQEALAGRVTLLVGQSGVGKSSLVNALAPAAAALTAELTREAEGRHTTTTARRYPLRPDTAIVDAPGVRDFAPPASVLRAAERGFIEIHGLSPGCRFKDCRHLDEPGCAVRDGGVEPRRYESYRRLFRLYQKLSP